jgi:hypothetical protein
MAGRCVHNAGGSEFRGIGVQERKCQPQQRMPCEEPPGEQSWRGAAGGADGLEEPILRFKTKQFAREQPFFRGLSASPPLLGHPLGVWILVVILLPVLVQVVVPVRAMELLTSDCDYCYTGTQATTAANGSW